MQFKYDHQCFGCGEQNPAGLKLKFVQEGEIISTTFVPPEIYQGYPGILHGGITSTVFDDPMSQCVAALGKFGFTSRLEVRFRKKIPVLRPVRFEAWIVKQKGPIVDIESRAILEDGELAAEAKARFMLTKEETES